MLITGDMLREAREAAGVTLSEMARRIYRDKGYLSRVETRCGAAPEHIIEQYEQALGVEMNRRGLLAGVAAGVVIPEAIVDALRRGFDQESGEPLSVDDWMAKLEQYAVDAMTTGTGEMQTLLAADLLLLLLQQQMTGPRMWGIAARMMVLHGAPLSALDKLTAIERWYRSAVVAADRSEDTAVRVWVRGRSALNMAHPSAPLRACRDIAEQAAALSPTPSVGRLTAFVSLANVEALNGNKAASLAALDEARRVFDTVDSTTAEPSEHTMPEWRMNVDISLVMSRLGDARASQAHDTAVESMPAAFTRFATHLELHRGLALAKAGDRVNGVAHARQALARLPARRHSVALRRLFTEVAA